MSDEIIDAEVITEGIEVPRNEEIIEAIEHGMDKMYLSGPMTGFPNYNHELFDRVAAEFRQVGFSVCSPAEFFDGDITKERKEYMRESIKYLLEADTVVLLPGWGDSKGARLEAAIATELDLSIVEYIEEENQSTYVGSSLTPIEEDQNFGSFTPIEETTKET
jgi:hypothetical protein